MQIEIWKKSLPITSEFVKSFMEALFSASFRKMSFAFGLLLGNIEAAMEAASWPFLQQ
jgi:hypothetical protein